MRANRQSGQALLELAVGMFAILVVFSGLLFVAALGNDNIECLLEANRDAARGYAQGMTGGNAGMTIASWDAGNDKILYSKDDIAGTSDSGNPSLFKQEINPAVMGTEYQSDKIFAKDYVANRDFANLPTSNFFVSLASLNRFIASRNNSLRERGLSDLENSFRTLFGTRGNFLIEQTVYYPDSQ